MTKDEGIQMYLEWYEIMLRFDRGDGYIRGRL
jgi:hypothetical protein